MHPAHFCYVYSRRRVWTIEEDEAIRQMVMKYGTKSWALIAENLSKEHSIAGRSGKQCRERWHNHLGKLFYITLATNLPLDPPLNPLFVLLSIPPHRRPAHQQVELDGRGGEDHVRGAQGARQQVVRDR